MDRRTLTWIIVGLMGGLFLVGRALLTDRGMGKVYVRAVEINSDDPDPDHRWTRHENALPRDYAAAVAANPEQTEYRFSLARTVGTWVAAFFTLFILSFLYKDNSLYKIAESVVVGVSAAYWMVVGFWTTIIPNLLGKLFPVWINSWAMPGLRADAEWVYIFPLILGVMLLMRLSPKGGWISRWPLAFIIGTTAGIRLIGYLHADFLSQIRNTIVTLWATDMAGSFQLWDSLKSLILVIGVLSALVYFFFSIEHKGIVGKTAKLGIWFLMVTFGAAFGYTVMGRIALLAIRLEFLLDDWLWLIDPALRRIGM
ncbi:MAG: hypothetical protein V3U24_08170 [Candidatus Neomarinimicrobiota bacterium]